MTGVSPIGNLHIIHGFILDFFPLIPLGAAAGQQIHQDGVHLAGERRAPAVPRGRHPTAEEQAPAASWVDDGVAFLFFKTMGEWEKTMTVFFFEIFLFMTSEGRFLEWVSKRTSDN